MLDYYQVLEVARNATKAEIKTAYLRLVLKWHLEKNPNLDNATKKFREISEAYEVLSDAEGRRRFDQSTQETFTGGRDHHLLRGQVVQNIFTQGSTVSPGMNWDTVNIVNVSNGNIMSCSSTTFENGKKITTEMVIENGIETTTVFENDILKSETVRVLP